MAARGVTVWDPWIRLTHWAIVILLPFSFWTAKTSRYDLHFLSGYTILTLMIFRLAWGLVGSETARFAGFLRGPVEAIRHLRHVQRREAAVDVGHNAAGGWMVLVLILLLLTQATTGLFAAHDPGMTYSQHGPLSMRVSEAWSAFATSVHLRVIWVIVAAAVLHVAAVIAYRAWLGRDLVRPMVTGRLEVPPGTRAPRMGNAVLAMLLLAGSAGFVWWISTLRPASMF